jgi:hypothetical protein
MPTHPGRNEPCPCGSGKKYKHCCLAKDETAERERLEAEASQPPEPAKAESGAQAATPPRTTRPPKHSTRQPWKRTEARGPMFNIPRRSGGS